MNEKLKILEQKGIDYKIIYLDARTEVLLSRYELSRRKHPLNMYDTLISNIEAERGTRVEFIYDNDDEMSPISEMVLSSRTLKLDLDVNKSNSVLILFARIEELLKGITTDVKELLRTHERSVKIISDSVEIMDAMLR